MKNLIRLFFFLTSILPSLSQNIYFPVYHYESENGLIHLNVLSIQKDKNNVLYFVTQGGVYEYKGQQFEKHLIYSSLKNVRNIFFNDTSTFLVHRDKGVFVCQQQKIKPLFPENPFKRPCDKIILTSQYCYNYTDQISVEFYDYKNKIYYNDSILLKDNSNQAYCMQLIKDKIFVGRKKGLYILQKNKIIPITTLSQIPVYSIFHHHTKHLIYLGSSGKIIVMDDSTFQIKQIIPIGIKLPNKSAQFLFKLEKNISKILVDNYDRIWFVTQPDDNIYLYEHHTIYDVLDVLSIMPTLINDMDVDVFNNIWIATFNDGLYQINSTYWKSYRYISNQRILNIKKILQHNEHIYYATNNGLFYTDTHQVSLFHPIVPPDDFFNTESFSIQSSFKNIFATIVTEFTTKIFDVKKDKLICIPFKYLAVKDQNYCYVSDITNNIMLYNYRTQKILDTIFIPSDFKLNINDLYCDSTYLFIATNKGLFIYHIKNKNISHSIENKEVQRIVPIDKTLYILYEDKVYDYTHQKILLDASTYKFVTLTDIEKYGSHYFISGEEGLMLVDDKFNFINAYGRRNGLISNVVHDILIFNQQILIATDKGISYTPIHNLFNDTAHLITPSLTFITTNKDTIHTAAPLRAYQFAPSTQDIYFHIICPNYNPLTKVKYEYSLNQSDWISFENSPLHFSSLSGGNYTLQIRATDDNIHFTPPLVIEFEKKLNIQEKPWFWEVIIFIVAIIVIITILFIRRIERKKTAEKLKNIQQINLLKHQAMNAILSPHFIFNSLTGIQNYILKNDVDKASDYLSKFSRLIRMIIEKASLPNISLEDELKRLQFYLELEKERFEDKFEYEIKIDDNIDLAHTYIPNMIIQPYIENAILHGILQKQDKGHISISFALKSHFLEILIEDDGIGIIKGEEKKSKHHKSLATQTIAEILQINTQLYQKKQSVEIIDKSTLQPPQSGTIVKILIEL